MRRREVIFGLSSAVTLPFAARAQQKAVPVVGMLNTGSADAFPDRTQAFHEGLHESGYAEGKNLTVEYRWADNKSERWVPMVADLVRRNVDVIVANYPAVLAAKAQTTKIPIVFTGAADPIQNGLVTSLNRPGGNITGVHLLGVGLDAKRLELLHQLVPGTASIGVLIDPKYPDAKAQRRELKVAASAISRRIEILEATSEADIDVAFSGLAEHRSSALLVASSQFFGSCREQLVALAARAKLPAIYNQGDFAGHGGLISYGSDFADGYRLAGVYVGKILNGAAPSELPVIQPTRFELAINLKTAKALGLTVPQLLLAQADEVIE